MFYETSTLKYKDWTMIEKCKQYNSLKNFRWIKILYFFCRKS